MTDTAAAETSASDLVGQKLQSVEEVYVYKIPPLKTAGGHRAEDWNLASPLKTCSLLVEQHGNVLLLLFKVEKAIFAQAKIDLTQQTKDGKKLSSLEYFVENVVDSSRYFVVRIVDERSGREARIGFGFRDRDEAIEFQASLQYYVRSIKRQEEASDHMHHTYDDLGAKLKLEEGQKIHINLGNNKKSTISKASPEKKKSSSGGPFLLKKPPAAPKLDTATDGDAQKTAPAAQQPTTPKLNKDIAISFGDIDINADHKKAMKEDACSTAAMGEASSADDDDIWQDFEDGGSAGDK